MQYIPVELVGHDGAAIRLNAAAVCMVRSARAGATTPLSIVHTLDGTAFQVRGSVTEVDEKIRAAYSPRPEIAPLELETKSKAKAKS